jgi:hypothetical protein
MINTAGTGYIIPTWLLSTAIGELVISILGIIANLLLLYTHMKDPCKVLKCSSSPFIINIAVIDLLASFSSLVESVLLVFFEDSYKHWLHNYARFKILYSITSLQIIIMFSSFLSLSIVRFSSVAFPLWQRVKITTRVCRYWLAAMWLFHGTSEGIANFLLHFYGYVFGIRLGKLFFVSLLFVFTQSFYLASYISIKKQRNNLSNIQDLSESSIRTTRVRLENEKNFLITIATVCLISAISFIPYLTLAPFVIVSLASPDEIYSETILLKLFTAWEMIILTLNHVMNGPIYVWRMKKYRKTFKKLFCIDG